MMGRTAGFHPDKTLGQLGEEGQYVLAPERLGDDHAPRSINAMNLARSRPTVRASDGGLELNLVSSFGLGLVGERCYGRTSLDEGQSAFVALSWRGRRPTIEEEAFSELKRTVEFWRNWLSGATIPDHLWRSFIERSALTLKGLSYAPTGAIMAAATTSLPETPGGARNWDYRSTWIRDSAFMLRSL